MAPQPAAYIEAIPAWNHDVEQKKSRRLALGVGNQIAGSAINPDIEACCLEMVVDQSGDVSVIFQEEYALAQMLLLTLVLLTGRSVGCHREKAHRLCV
jgi:hypothetical protein